MAKDPAFLLYSKDFLTGVQDLTMEERGQYITMLCAQHQKGKCSSKWLSINIPNASSDVLSKFEKDEDGNYINSRLSDEIETRKLYRPRKIASATLGGLISRSGLSNADSRKIKDEFNISDFEDFDEKEMKQNISIWFKHMLNYIVNANANVDIDNSKVSIKERKENFKKELEPFLETYNREMLNDFYYYWTEHGDSDKKFRAEKETSFSLSRRLSRWKKNESEFKRKTTSEKMTTNLTKGWK